VDDEPEMILSNEELAEIESVPRTSRCADSGGCAADASDFCRRLRHRRPVASFF